MGDTYTPPPMPEGFNPYTQSVTLFYPDGSNGTFSMTDINLTLRSATTYSSSYGAQVGACTILLIILLIITPPAKRRSLHFGLNVFGLIVAIARGILCIHYYMSPWTDAYAMLGGDYSACSFSDKLLSVAPGGLMVLLQLDVQLALVLQMRIVLESTPTLNMIITFFTSAIALVSLGFLFSIQVEGNKAIMDDYTWYPDWKRTASNTFFLISIICFATVFSVKLGIAIRRRRLLGLEGFGPMQVIFTMGCQTMFVPAIFSLLPFFYAKDGLDQISPALVVLLLPLSGMWAAAITDGQKASSGVGFDTYTSAGKHSGGSSMRSGGTTMATMNSNNRLKPEYSPSTPGTPKRAAVMSQKDLEFDDNDSIDRGIEAIAPVRRRA